MSRLQTETIRNHQTMSERQTLFRRFEYDSAASLGFILAKAMPLPGRVLEIGTGKVGFLSELAKHAEHITMLDIDAEQQRLAKRHVRHGGPRCPIQYVIHDAGQLPWVGGSFDSVVSVNTFHHLERPMRVFAFVSAEPAQRKILGVRPMAAPPHQPGLFPFWLREQGTNVVIAGGIGRRALALFAQYGIEVRAGTPGAVVEALDTAYLNGQLVNEREGCAHHHDVGDGQHHPHDGHCQHDHE